MKLRIPRRIKAETPVEEDSEQSDSAEEQDKDKTAVVSSKSSTVSRIFCENNCENNPKNIRDRVENIFQG
jgi:hypothetical protein